MQMVFMSYIHNIVAGKVGVIVHAVLGVTCSVLLQNFGTVDIRVLMYWCYLALLFFGGLKGLNLHSQIEEQ